MEIPWQSPKPKHELYLEYMSLCRIWYANKHGGRNGKLFQNYAEKIALFLHMLQTFSKTTKNGSANKFCKALYNAD